MFYAGSHSTPAVRTSSEFSSFVKEIALERISFRAKIVTFSPLMIILSIKSFRYLFEIRGPDRMPLLTSPVIFEGKVLIKSKRWVAFLYFLCD